MHQFPDALKRYGISLFHAKRHSLPSGMLTGHNLQKQRHLFPFFLRKDGFILIAGRFFRQSGAGRLRTRRMKGTVVKISVRESKIVEYMIHLVYQVKCPVKLDIIRKINIIKSAAEFGRLDGVNAYQRFCNGAGQQKGATNRQRILPPSIVTVPKAEAWCAV